MERKTEFRDDLTVTSIVVDHYRRLVERTNNKADVVLDMNMDIVDKDLMSKAHMILMEECNGRRRPRDEMKFYHELTLFSKLIRFVKGVFSAVLPVLAHIDDTEAISQKDDIVISSPDQGQRIV